MGGFLILIVLSEFVSILQGKQKSSFRDNHSPMCCLDSQHSVFEYEYYKSGDVIIGGLFSAYISTKAFITTSTKIELIYYCNDLDIVEYKIMLSFFFAINEINKDPNLLPNITLGYHLFDTCTHNMKAIDSALKILSGYKENIPNYSCVKSAEIAGFVGDTTFLPTLAVAELLNVYQYPQINHRVTDPLLSNRQKFPYFYRTIPSSSVWYDMVLKILQIFGWNLVGVITSSDGTGENELQYLKKEMIRHGICIEYVVYLTNSEEINKQRVMMIEKSTTDVIVVCGYFLSEYILFCQESKTLREKVTFILNESWNVIRYPDNILKETCNCSLSPFYPLRFVPGLDDYINNIHLDKNSTDPLLEDICIIYFNCLSYNSNKNLIFRSVGISPNTTCTGTESVTHLFHNKFDSKFYFTYNAVYLLAHALNSMKLSKNSMTAFGLIPKIHRYIRALQFTSITREKITLNEEGEVPSEIYLTNMIYDNASPGMVDVKKKIFINERILEKVSFKDSTTAFYWKNDKFPQARCNEPCLPGYRKGSTEGISACCYRCVQCSDGAISNVTDSESCRNCPDDQWPDERKVKCIPKTYEYLSFETDIIAKAFHSITVLCSAVTVCILILFILLWDTPIVKANNRTMSFFLLISILLSFLSVFLFFRRPVDITCQLRQISFGFFFSVAMSCILAKTITVCIAFKASKPSNYWRKWVEKNISNPVAIICSSVQVLICVIWLSVSPPYQENDMHSFPGKIIIQCHEGSVIGFFSMLGYLGFLAVVSFVLAFMVRTLPDSFNEAKYITFSMLVFCSVWISMIPAYLSTRGKYTVAVEILSILASSAGVLGCIFFPKCYIIILKPEKNSRKHIFDKSKSQRIF